MMSRLFSTALVCSVLLMFSSGARSQVVWHYFEPSGFRYSYTFYGLDCLENECVAPALKFDLINGTSAVILFRSTNSGLTWEVGGSSVPGIPRLRDCIQLIDHRNIVIIGKAGLLLRSMDSGLTWSKQDCHTKNDLTSVHFSDSLNGIAVTYNAKDTSVFTTLDGGITWIGHPIKGAAYGRSYGDEKFRVFKPGKGVIVSTHDDWKTIDSTEQIFDSGEPDAEKYWFGRCQFSDGEKILAFGSSDILQPVLMYSSTNGTSWEKAYENDQNFVIFGLGSIDQDTIYYYANDGNPKNYMINSHDGGKSWQVDTLLLDSSHLINTCWGMDVNAFSKPVAIFDNGLAVIIDSFQLSVERGYKIKFISSVYPNPASSEVVIWAVNRGARVQLIDILGNAVAEGNTDSQGNVTLDVSGLPRGIYSVIKDRGKSMVPIGKVAVTGER